MRTTATLAVILTAYSALLCGAQPPDAVQIGKDKLWQAPRPDLPDLSVQFISRTPRYPGLAPEYVNIDDPVHGQGPTGPVTIQNQGAQRWPEPGQTVTWTAVVRNAGPQPITGFDWHWLYDGDDVRSGEYTETVKPGQTVSFTLKRPWQAGKHFIAFQVDRDNLREEISEENNWVIDRTDALSFALFVEESTRAWFQTVRGGLGSYDWADWAQFQVRQMNKEFRDTIYPSAPEGIIERVRLDRVYVIPDGWGSKGGMHTPGLRLPADLDDPEFYNANEPPADVAQVEVFNNVNGGVDGVWGFTVDLINPDPNKGDKNFYEFAPHWLTGSEWPLHHELGHQLGRADHYLIWSDPNDNPAAPGAAWQREPSYKDGIMYHGNYSHDANIGHNTKKWDSTYRFYSEHTAASFNRDKGVRRGLFGEYFFDVPAATTFTFLDENLEPVKNATVEIFVGRGRGYTGCGFNAEPHYTGETSSAGTYALSQSPWEHVFIWGNNGVVMFKLTPPDASGGAMAAEDTAGADAAPGTLIGFRDLGHFNTAYWRGHTDHAKLTVPVKPYVPPAE